MTSSETGEKRAPQPPLEHVQGIVERVTFHGDDSGYTVARLKVPQERDLLRLDRNMLYADGAIKLANRSA